MAERDSESHVRPTGHREIQLAPGLAKTLVALVISGYGVVDAVKFLRYEPAPVPMAIGLFATVVILLMQLFHFSSAARRNGRGRLPMLFTQAVFAYAPAAWLGIAWLGMPSFVASSCLLVLSPPVAWTAFSAIVLSNVVQEALFDESTVFALTYVFVSSAITALVVYGLTRMAELVSELQQSRAALAQIAVEKERMRFARDLHDLLGYSLSAVTLKVELCRRLGKDNWASAGKELEEILRISRQALADVRMVSSGYRQMSLETELQSVRSILGVAGIDAETQVGLDVTKLSEQTNTVLATVLREGVTNMLRHSDPQRCEIALDRADGKVRLCMTNDGVRGISEDECVGNGIRNLITRVESLGGRLSAGVRPDGWFHLRAEVDDGLSQARPPGDDGAFQDSTAPGGWRSWARKAGLPSA